MNLNIEIIAHGTTIQKAVYCVAIIFSGNFLWKPVLMNSKAIFKLNFYFACKGLESRKSGKRGFPTGTKPLFEMAHFATKIVLPDHFRL
jgi:hypothetical protein